MTGREIIDEALRKVAPAVPRFDEKVIADANTAIALYNALRKCYEALANISDPVRQEVEALHAARRALDKADGV